MVNTEIFEGLKRATQSGQSLREAMITFYNSGYLRQEIEEAARALQAETPSMGQTQKPVQMQNQFQQPQIPNQIQPQQISNQFQQQNQTQQISQQKISAYEQPKKKNKIAIIFLILMILLLIGVLISAFIFKSEIIDFFRKSFGA